MTKATMNGTTNGTNERPDANSDVKPDAKPDAVPPMSPPEGSPLAIAQAQFAQWQARAAQAGLTLREPPPVPTTCCGRGCNGCVWEGYYAAATYWLEEAALRLG